MTQDNDSDIYEDVIGEFIALLRAGKEPSVEEFASQRSDVADELCLELEGARMAEYLRPKATTVMAVEPLKTPTEIGGYRIIRKLAAGGMSTVYEAWQDSLQRKVVIKLLSEERSASPQFTERFEREAISASRLHHPNIVPVFDYGVDNGVAWLAMQFIEGQSLDHLACYAKVINPIRTEQSWKDIALIGSQVAGALVHVHEKGTLHRDIKPANLIHDAEGKTWVTDFGLAKLRDDDSNVSQTGDMIGTPRYMAPEQIRGVADARSDIYSLGITLWELCSGECAWDETTNSNIAWSKNSGVELRDVSSVNPNVPKPLADIIMRACSSHPQCRYQSAEELRHVLNRFAHGERVGDRRSRPRDSQFRPYLRRPFIALAVLAMTIGVFVTFAARSKVARANDSHSAKTQQEPVVANTPAPEAVTQPASQELHFLVPKSASGQAFRSTRGSLGVPSAIVGGADADLFYIDRLTGAVQLRNETVRQISTGDTLEVEVAISRDDVVSGFAFGEIGEEAWRWNLASGMAVPYNDLWESNVPALLKDKASLRGTCSANGKTLYHVHANPGGGFQLWKSSVQPQRFSQSKLIRKNVNLPSDMVDLATADGRHFYVVAKSGEGEYRLDILTQGMDGQLRPRRVSRNFKLPNRIITATMQCEKNIMLLVDANGKLESWNLELADVHLCCIKTGVYDFHLPLEMAASWSKNFDVSKQGTFRLQLTMADDISNVSTQGGSSMLVNFHNETDEHLVIVWVDQNGTRVPYQTVKPNAIAMQQTYTGHVWEIYGRNGKCWQTTVADKKVPTVKISKPQVLDVVSQLRQIADSLPIH